MLLAEVIGPVVSTVKHPTYVGLKLLAVRPIVPEGNTIGKTLLAVDRVQAGEGDRVLILREGTGVRQLFKQDILPIRSVIAAIVDQVDVPDYDGLEPGEAL